MEEIPMIRVIDGAPLIENLKKEILQSLVELGSDVIREQVDRIIKDITNRTYSQQHYLLSPRQYWDIIQEYNHRFIVSEYCSEEQVIKYVIEIQYASESIDPPNYTFVSDMEEL